jgi:hypothetical protein
MKLGICLRTDTSSRCKLASKLVVLMYDCIIDRLQIESGFVSEGFLSRVPGGSRRTSCMTTRILGRLRKLLPTRFDGFSTTPPSLQWSSSDTLHALDSDATTDLLYSSGSSTL